MRRPSRDSGWLEVSCSVHAYVQLRSLHLGWLLFFLCWLVVVHLGAEKPHIV